MLTVSGIDVPRTVEEAVCLDRAALLVYDMQVGILRQLAGADAVVEKVRAVLDAARDVGLRTYFVRHTSLPKNLMGRFQIRQALAWQRTDDPDEITPWFPPDAEGTQITPELAPRATEAVFDKLSMSAFEGTPLDFALRDCDVRTLLVCGVATEIGIEPTVRHAADLGYLPVVIEDACGPGHAAAGARALESLRFMGDALFTTVAEITGLLRDKAPEPPSA
ncbi:cysteine hydrolase [Rubrivirga sp.]|uniref:cysteine hydrolase n=1 Tax=Rubrivirga sp. TaxID=1885344 RepID=UPI003B51C003